MSYQINDVSLNLSNPIDKYWYSKHKNNIKRNNVDFISSVIDDAKNGKCVNYSPRYYACAKFISLTTNLKFKKIQKYTYYIRTFNDDFCDTFTVGNKTDLMCSVSAHMSHDNKGQSGGKRIGMCKSGCCSYYKRNNGFSIQWI